MQAVSSGVKDVFAYLSDVSCGSMTGEQGSYVMLCAKSSKKLTDDELETIENYVKSQTGAENVTLQITQPKK